MSSTLGWRISSIVLLTIVIVIDYLFKDYWPQVGANLTYEFQLNSNEYLDVIFRGFAKISIAAVGMIPLMIYLWDYTTWGIQSIFIYSLTMWLTSMLKLAYANDRPFWHYDFVEYLDCEHGFGNPSGHALGSAAVWSLLVLKDKHPGASILVLVCIIVTGINRVYLGVHYFSQVLLGWAWAYAITAWRDPLFQLATKLNTLMLHLVALGLCIASLLLFAFRDPYWDPVWEENSGDCDISSERALNQGLQGCAMLAIFLGVWIGYKYGSKRVAKFSAWVPFYTFAWAFVMLGAGFIIELQIKRLECPYLEFFFNLLLFYAIGILTAFPGKQLQLTIFKESELSEKLIR